MKITQRYYIFLMYVLVSLTACVSVADENKPNIYNTWVLEKIIYDDGSAKVLTEGNFVQIHEDYLVEMFKEYGNRRYAYVRNNKTISLDSGGEKVVWEIVLHNNQELQIKTPIGLYILKYSDKK